MTVLEAIHWAERTLTELDSPRLEAELILSYLLGWKRHVLFLNHSRELSDVEFTGFRELINRRSQREPISHITGTAAFLDMELLSGSEALVPRPETEILVETFLRLLPTQQGMLLDVGTGSGNIALSLASRCPGSLIIASDVSPAALSLAAKNRGIFDPVNLLLLCGDMMNALMPGKAMFHGIVANLPYIPSGEIPSLQPEVREGDPHLALDGGMDGLELVLRLCTGAPAFLRRGGLIALELAPSQVPVVWRLLQQSGDWSTASRERDLSGRERFVTAFRA